MTIEMKLILFLVIVLGFFSDRFSASASLGHRYNVVDHVPLFVNKIGPLNNPRKSDPTNQKRATLGEVLNDHCLTNALYEVKFRENKNGEILCEKKLKAAEVAQFRDAVRDDYYFQMYYDDLPLWGFIGKIEEQHWSVGREGQKYFSFNHVQFV